MPGTAILEISLCKPAGVRVNQILLSFSMNLLKRLFLQRLHPFLVLLQHVFTNCAVTCHITIVAPSTSSTAGFPLVSGTLIGFCFPVVID